MTTETITSCLTCGLHEPRRNTYFDGKMLLERDFVAEQDYHRGHRHLHNAMLHGTGTVCGLKVIQHPSPDCRREYVVVEPGLALDCCGQEIVVPERSLVRVRHLIDHEPDLQEALDGRRHLMVAIRRCDYGAEQVPALLAGCEGADGPTEFGRVAEGFEFVVFARDPADLTPVDTPVRPRLTWEHTITLGGQLPRRVHLNGDERLVQVAADVDAGGSHMHVFDDATNDLFSLLEGPAHLTDTASVREARLLLAAGEGFGDEESAHSGVAFWRRDELTTSAEPVGVLPIEGTTVRTAVSPVSGTLFVLSEQQSGSEDDDGVRATLASYSMESIVEWLADVEANVPPDPVRTLELDHGLGDEDGPAQRGAAMLTISHDGRFLAFAGPPAPDEQRVYIAEVAAFNAGGMAQETAVAAEIPAGTAAVALAWSLDDEVLYLLAAESGPRAIVQRYAMTGDGNTVERRGRGVSLDGTPRDLAVAPTETRAYVLLEDPDGIARLTTVDIERVKAVTGAEPEHVELSADTLRIDGDGRSVALATSGGRLYVAAGDAEPEGLPARGLVAVVDIQEDDCSLHIDRQVEGCPGCAAKTDGHDAAGRDGSHAVVLAHLPLYDADAEPRMVDAEEAGEDDAAIDNLTYRQIVPSAATLRDVIMCMLARGIDEGPPGPRGDPGQDGEDGRSITEVEVEVGEPGRAATATTSENASGLTLELGLPGAPPGARGPQGTPGPQGAPGKGIDDARISYDGDLDEPEVDLVEEDGQRILDIRLPEPEAAPKRAGVNSIVALSWPHGGEYPTDQAFLETFRSRGVAVAFRHPVRWEQFTGTREGGPTMVAELQRRVPLPVVRDGEWLPPSDSDVFVWATIDHLGAVPITFDPDDAEDGLLTEWEVEEPADETSGFALMPWPHSDFAFRFAAGDTLRLVFYADFPMSLEVGDGRPLPLSGGHIRGELPTGEGGPGDTFRSWFTIVEL